MMYEAIGNMKLSEVLRDRTTGEPINKHVVQAAPEPKPDFAAMRELVHGTKSPVSKQQAPEKNEK